MVQLENENGKHNYSKKTKQKNKMKTMLIILLRLCSIRGFLQVQKTINLEMMNKLLFMFINISTFINKHLIDIVFLPNMISSNLLKTTISTTIPLLSLAYIEHIAISQKLSVSKKDVLSMMSSSGKSALLSSAMKVGMAGATGEDGYYLLNQVVLPSIGQGRHLNVLRNQCDLLINTTITGLFLQVVDDSMKVVEPIKQLKFLEKAYSKLLNKIWEKPSSKQIQNELSFLKPLNKRNKQMHRGLIKGEKMRAI